MAISFAGDFYAIEMKNNFGLKPLTSSSAYASVKFNEVLPRERYGGERYLITADSNEIVVYDLYTNNSIAGYAAGFSLPPKSVPIENGAYTFFLRKDVFPVVPNNYEIVSYAK